MGRNSHYAPYTAAVNAAARPTARDVFKGTGIKEEKRIESVGVVRQGPYRSTGESPVLHGTTRSRTPRRPTRSVIFVRFEASSRKETIAV
jgi:hypothetical protein